MSGKRHGNTGNNNSGIRRPEERTRSAGTPVNSGQKKKLPVGIALVICIIAALYGTGNLPQGGQGESTSVQQSQERQAGTQEIVYTFRSKDQLEDHYERHGREMGYPDEQSYVEGANRVVASPDALHKLEKEDGDDVYYLEETNEFVIVSTRGYIRTYFEPEDGIDYYNRQ